MDSRIVYIVRESDPLKGSRSHHLHGGVQDYETKLVTFKKGTWRGSCTYVYSHTGYQDVLGVSPGTTPKTVQFCVSNQVQADVKLLKTQ